MAEYNFTMFLPNHTIQEYSTDSTDSTKLPIYAKGTYRISNPFTYEYYDYAVMDDRFWRMCNKKDLPAWVQMYLLVMP